MALIAVLLVVGTILLLLEIVLPGMVAGMIGFGCLVAGVVLAYVDFGSQTGNFVLLAVTAGLVTAGILWIRYFPHSRLGQLFVTRKSIGGLDVEQPELLNATGAAMTRLRPSGTALIDGKRVDVVTEGELVDPGTPVKVVAIEGLRVVVRAL